MKKIIFIPPNGKIKKQDYALERIAKSLRNNHTIETVLLYIGDKNIAYMSDFDRIIRVSSEERLFATLHTLQYDTIFVRGWMHAYSFSAEIVKQFQNVVVNIKDWNFSTREIYKFLFERDDDFEAIEYIFKNAKYILSHYTTEQANIWAREYQVDKSKFLFFPDMCNEDYFYKKQNTFNIKNIHLVYAGRIASTSLPEEYFPNKAHLYSVKLITSQGINIDYVIPENIYIDMCLNKHLYLDFFYEDKFNKNFNIVKGKVLNASVLEKYNFGFFELHINCHNEALYRYAVISKFIFYLEAGLPILVHEKFKSIAKMVKENKLGIVFSNNDLYRLNELLNIDKIEYENFLLNIVLFREKFKMLNKNVFTKL